MHSRPTTRPYLGPAPKPTPPTLAQEASAAERAMGWLLVGGLILLIAKLLLC